MAVLIRSEPKRHPRWRSLLRMLVVVLVGIGAVVASALPDPGMDGGWWRDVLMTVGASLALFAPIYYLTRSLDRHLDQVAADTAQRVEDVRSDAAQRVEEVRTEAAQMSDSLTGQVAALRADVGSRLDDVAEAVAARLAVEEAADRAAFAALRIATTREVVWDAFVRAHGLGLVSVQRSPRVRISRATQLYLSVELDHGDWADEPLQLQVEGPAGHVADYIPWREGRGPEDVLVEVGRALYKQTGETLDTNALFNGFADLLEAAMSHPERRPAIMLCPPQWMVCDWGLVPYEGRVYTVTRRDLHSSSTLEAHVANKEWVDPDSWDAACQAIRTLFPASLHGDPWAPVETSKPLF